MAQLDAVYFANNELSSSHARLREDLLEELQSQRDVALHQLVEESKGLGFLSTNQSGSTGKNVSATAGT
jgi:hypothetical protein